MSRFMSVAVLMMVLVGCSGSALEKNRPVSKVLTLLKDMVGQLETEAKEDEKVKEAMDCWCETGLRDKTQANADNEDKIGRLQDSIESGAAQSARLSNEINTLEKEVAENTEALEKATAMREKQLAEFSADEKSMITAISQMGGAVEAIAAKSFLQHHRTGVQSFLQQSASVREKTMRDVAATLKTLLHQHHALITPGQRAVVSAFLHSHLTHGEYSLLQEGSKFSSALSSPSSGILGVLKGMKEGFEKNVAASQEEETTNQSDYAAMKKAKTDEIAAGTDLADKKTKEKGDTDQKHAQDSQDLQDTENTLAADTDFLKNLKEQCANVDAEYAERVKTRQQEITAVSKALAYLNSDDAQDLYSRTFSFVQLRATNSARRLEGAKVLRVVAEKAQDPRLSALAVRVMAPQDAFEEVRNSIQEMVDKLVAEKQDEIKHKEYCVDSIRKNEADTNNKNRAKDDHTYKISELTGEIGKLSKEIKELNAAIDESHVSLKRAGEDREKQSTEFQHTVADQRATAKLLEGALNILKGFYDKMSLAQQGAPPPAGFKKREGASSGGVMGMMQQIIDDAKAMEAEAIRGEEESQKGFETFVNELNDSIVDMQEAITHKSETKALKDGEKAQNEVSLQGVEAELSDLKSENEDLHGDCDYTIKNFDKKQSARDDEITGLKEAISIFSGASFGSFLQTFEH